ncbi:GNAT family N-acetyltransferase [Eubacterium sp. AF17-7]|jgi:GNAT superfamily N-acetyltransferase|uniref:GNAT family N-acetyltransferase n=1 Tax=Eubacterium sp. AF17-7 TaxID=2293105 RepID=UPI000E4A19A1|nr:GNAT family N-acetyltransferase [Eubacterium sp. AF17-7]RGG63120.1 GNAT family N-acetyltransferase [Eubacterium sp. AF17-7]
MKYTIKENQLNYETYYTLRKSVEWNNWSKEQAEKALENSYYSIVIFYNDNAIGMGRVVGDGIYFTIVDVVVRSEYQGRKIGTTIMNSILEYIEKNMCEGSRVSVQLLAEVGKEQFYIKQGFKLVPHEYCGPALRKIIYKK